MEQRTTATNTRKEIFHSASRCAFRDTSGGSGQGYDAGERSDPGGDPEPIGSARGLRNFRNSETALDRDRGARPVGSLSRLNIIQGK